jgi:four helix bundle protein
LKGEFVQGNSVAQKKAFDFSLLIIQLYKKMIEQKEFVLSKQLLRCGTSIGANIEEALAAQSRKDFVHKMSIASKEARETLYWLRLLKASKLVSLTIDEYLNSADEIVRILTSIVKTSSLNGVNSKLKIKN